MNLIVEEVVKHLVDITVDSVDSIACVSTHEDDIENKSNNCLKRGIHSDDHHMNPKKRIKYSDTSDKCIDILAVNSSDSQLNPILEDSKSCEGLNDVMICDNQLVVKNQNHENYVKECHNSSRKTPKQVKWRTNIVNPHFSEDSLNVLLSKTYYFFGTGIVTGEAGDMFGGNRFQGFSRHLFSDSCGITVELCKPFIINRIIIDLEDKCHKKSPLFAYKVFVAVDECMTEWQLIQEFDQTVCFGQQDIDFYPRIVQYIRIVGSHGVYHKTSGDSEPTIARYFTLLHFDCTFDHNIIQ